MAKVNISINDELLAEIDAYADENYTSRSGLIQMGMAEFIKSKQLAHAIQSMSVSLAKIASTGVCTDEELDELAKLTAFVSYMPKG